MVYRLHNPYGNPIRKSLWESLPANLDHKQFAHSEKQTTLQCKVHCIAHAERDYLTLSCFAKKDFTVARAIPVYIECTNICGVSAQFFCTNGKYSGYSFVKVQCNETMTLYLYLYSCVVLVQCTLNVQIHWDCNCTAFCTMAVYNRRHIECPEKCFPAVH